MPRPHALVFDAYGTIFNVHSVAARCDELFPGKGQALSALWRSRQLEYSWQRSLMGRYVDFDQVTADALKYACEALQLTCSAALRAELAQGYRTLQPFDDARDALAELSAMSPAPRLAILSNGAPDMLNALVAHNGMEKWIPDVMSVDAVGIFKPDPRVYQLVVERLKLPAPQIGFVSSNGWDAAGAKAFGFKVHWINRSGAPVEELGVKPDHILTSLRELPGLLAGI